MVKNLDNRDKRIMFELDKNSRQSITEISKKTKIPRNIVNYRIEKLIEEGIITKFVTEVALGKIGYFTYKIYCQISGLSKFEQEKFYNNLIKNKDFIWVAKCEGRWDLLLASYSRNIIEFNKIKKSFLLKYGKHISDYSITIVDEAYILERIHLLEDKKSREFFELYIGGSEIVELDSKDKELLRILANDARIKIIDISKKLGLNIRTILSKINILEKKGVIQGYTTFFDLKKIKYQFFKSCIYLKDLNERRYSALISFCKNNKNVIHLIESVGPWEVEIEVESKTNKEFQELNNEIRNSFSDIVRKVESVIISDEMKLEFLPKKI
jgi:Lrp/AsnC family transcriptional regulator, leucine-responsive regulatory protein